MENLTLNDTHPPSSSQHDLSQPQQPLGASSSSTPAPPLAPSGPPQLPPQMFTTAAQLLDLTDKKLLLVLRDGRKLQGILRSWDQFANLVLASTVERYYVSVPTDPSSLPPAPQNSTASNSHQPPPNPQSQSEQQTRKLYADVPRGTYLVRGENVLLIGEIDLDKDEDDPPGGYVRGEVEEVWGLVKMRERTVEGKDGRERRKREEGLRGLWGGEVEGRGEVLY